MKLSIILFISLLFVSCSVEDQTEAVKVKTTRQDNPSSNPPPTSNQLVKISDFEGDWILFHATTNPVMVRIDVSKINDCDAYTTALVDSIRINGRHYKIQSNGSMGLAEDAYITNDHENLDFANIYHNIKCRISKSHRSFNFDMIMGKMPTTDSNISVKFGYANLKIKNQKLLLGGLYCYQKDIGDKLFFCQNEIFIDEEYSNDVFYLKNLKSKEY